MRWALAGFALVVSLGLGLIGCEDRHAKAELAASLENVLSGKPFASVSDSTWKNVRDFYATRRGAPVWLSSASISKRAAGAERALDFAQNHGLSPADYGLDAIRSLHSTLDHAEKGHTASMSQLAELDVRLTAGLLALGHDVALGRTRPEALDPRWKARRAVPDLVETLASNVKGDLNAWLRSLQPKHAHYAALQNALAKATGDQAQRIALNLERWRWMPDDLGQRYLLVNIPSYQVLAQENGATTLDIRVVVGKPGNETPIFSAEMTAVVFSPYWNIPDTIVVGETAPAVGRDPTYLERHAIDVLRVSKSGAEPVDPSTIDWSDPAELQELAFRQRPGAGNALGFVKFLLPNPYDVYLHDTPADELFVRPSRAFSHGCVRVEEPEALAKYVLRDKPEWDEPRMRAAMHAGVEKQVKLTAPIPVHIVYFTAWPDASGNVHFLPDVYKYDARQANR